VSEGVKLKSKERSAIMAGEHPKIVRPYKQGEGCPFAKGEQVVIQSQRTHGKPAPLVSITILGHNRTKNGSWEAEYSVRDDRGLYLAKGVGYTRSASDSLDWEASVEDPETLKRFSTQGRLHRVERKANEEVEIDRQNKAARSKLTETLSGLGPEARTAWLAEFDRMCQKAKMKDVA
jgi:hypothetical protein